MMKLKFKMRTAMSKNAVSILTTLSNKMHKLKKYSRVQMMMTMSPRHSLLREPQQLMLKTPICKLKILKIRPI